MDVWSEAELAAYCYLIHHPAEAKAAPIVSLPSLPPLYAGEVPPPPQATVRSASSTHMSAPPLSPGSLTTTPTPFAEDPLPLFLSPPFHHRPLPTTPAGDYTPSELFQLKGPFARPATRHFKRSGSGPAEDLVWMRELCLLCRLAGTVEDLRRVLAGQKVNPASQLACYPDYFAISPNCAPRLWCGQPSFQLSIASDFIRSLIVRGFAQGRG
ncbi:hypothetical protein JCM6882_000229 [Rhodosporidiobolus microsporus]